MSKENFQKELRLLAEDMVKQYAYTKELDAMVRPLDNPMNRRDFTQIEKDAWENFGNRIQKIYEKYKNEPFFKDEQPLKNSYPESVWLYAKTYCEDLPESYWVNRETKEKISNSDMWKGLEIDAQPDPDLFKKVVRPDITSAIEAQETIIQELCESGNFEDLSSKFNDIKDSANLMQQKTTLAYGTSEDFRKWASGVRAEERKPTKEEYDIVSTEALAMGGIVEGTVDPKLELEAPEKEELENTVETTDTPVVISEDVQEGMIPRSRQDRPKQPEQTYSYFRNEDTSLLQGIDPDASEENDLIDDFEDIEVGVKDSEDSSFVKSAVEVKENPKKKDSASKEDSLDRSDLQVATETIPVEDNSPETLVKESEKQVKKENVIEKPEDQTVKRDNPSQDSVRDILEVDGIKEPSKEGVVNPQAENRIKEQDPAVKTFNKEAIKNQVKTGKEDSVESASRGDAETVSMSEALGLSAPLVTDKKETSVVKDDDHIPHGMGLNEVGAGGALNDGPKKVLKATEEAAKQASESSKAVQKTAKNVSIKDRLKDVATNKDWTDITAEAKKAQDNAWRPVDAIESVSSQFALGIKNGVGNDNELRSEANQSEFRKNEEELEEAEKFSETGSEKFSEEGKGIGRKVINTPGDTASKAGEAWNKKKQVEEKLKKFKKKKAERLKAKEAAQKQAVDAQNTAKMARKAQTTSQAATGTAEAPGAVAQAGAMNSAQISQELGRNAVIQSSAQAADTAQKATQVAAETAKNAAETSANTAATASTTAAEAGSGPIGWILLIVEAAIVVFIASTLAILAICFIVALFSSEDEDGYATAEQRVEFQKHMLRVAEVYNHNSSQGCFHYDDYIDEIYACVEFDPNEVKYSNLPRAAKSAIGDDTYTTHSGGFHPNDYCVRGPYDTSGAWCAVFAGYLYANGAYDHYYNNAFDWAGWQVWNVKQNFVQQGLVKAAPSGYCYEMLDHFIEEGHAVAVGNLSSSARYIPTVGDAVFLDNDASYGSGKPTAWHVAPSHVEVVIAVNYNTGYFYTINGNNGSDEGMGLRKRSFKNEYGVYDSICAFGRVCSRPDEYYVAEASM